MRARRQGGHAFFVAPRCGRRVAALRGLRAQRGRAQVRDRLFVNCMTALAPAQQRLRRTVCCVHWQSQRVLSSASLVNLPCFFPIASHAPQRCPCTICRVPCRRKAHAQQGFPCADLLMCPLSSNNACSAAFPFHRCSVSVCLVVNKLMLSSATLNRGRLERGRLPRSRPRTR